MIVVRPDLDSKREKRAEELQMGQVLYHREVLHADYIHMRLLLHHNAEHIEVARGSHCPSAHMRGLDIVEGR
jgi:hypothetical protein